MKTASKNTIIKQKQTLNNKSNINNQQKIKRQIKPIGIAEQQANKNASLYKWIFKSFF